MASKAPCARAYQPRRNRTWRRRRDRRTVQPVPTLAALLTVIPSLSRPELGRLVHRMIEHMDEMEGDTDLEPNGDELDGSMGEDDFCDHSTFMAGPGCSISDPDQAVDDAACDDLDQDREEESHLFPSYGADQSEPEPPQWSDNRAVRREHVQRIRRTRCRKTIYRNSYAGRDVVEYQLID